jgi:hypothetical protein
MNVACMGDRRAAETIWFRRPGGKNLKDLGVDGRIILKWIFKKRNGEAWTDLIWLKRGTGGGCLGLWYRTFGFPKMP